MKSYQKICIDKTVNGFSMEFADAADSQFSGYLLANTEQLVTVPNTQGGRSYPFNKKAYLAVLKTNQFVGTVWVALNQTVTVPTSTVGLGNQTMVIPMEVKTVYEGDILHFITGDTTAPISVDFYEV